jgi:hypothetical protein
MFRRMGAGQSGRGDVPYFGRSLVDGALLDAGQRLTAARRHTFRSLARICSRALFCDTPATDPVSPRPPAKNLRRG